jgi:mannobiose 2-epimerase
MMTQVLNTKTNHLHLFLDADWTPISDEISFGHDVEFSWLLTESAEVANDEELIKRANEVAVAVAEAVYEEAIDGDGAIFYEAGPDGITEDFKEWWVQSEACVGFLNACQISGDEKFLDASLNVWTFIEKNLVDHENGEWFARISRDRTTKSPGPKGHFWKTPYHNSRGCMEMITRLKKLQGED